MRMAQTAQYVSLQTHQVYVSRDFVLGLAEMDTRVRNAAVRQLQLLEQGRWPQAFATSHPQVDTAFKGVLQVQQVEGQWLLWGVEADKLACTQVSSRRRSQIIRHMVALMWEH